MLQESHQSSTTEHVLDYLNAMNESDPVVPGLIRDEVEANHNVIIVFADGIYDVCSSEKITDEKIRLEIISMFRPQSFQPWPNGLTY